MRRVVAGLLERGQHPPVGGEYLSDEPAYASLAGSGSKVLEQHGPEASSLMVITYDEGHLGIAIVDPVEPSDTDELTADCGDQCHPIHVIDVGEAVDVASGQLGIRSEEAEVDGLVGQGPVEGGEPVAIVSRDRADAHRAAVPDSDVGLPVGRRRGRSVRRVGHAAHRSGRRARSQGRNEQGCLARRRR